ncbi:Polyketide cyclase / dehydrase and lipid transport [Seminavis robusta]|uniref:Polyketide cyclase / dehydrase and lipid transport n=1 Tax=Seminavis robusta TaxID=568900 RepID=A0A9N8DPA4_9STRA|nr:Polyketide cyclase / dehydrase and lipid transport [Seminavis robusta]|eukprot:Sro190_g082020.1 Polyketide cyclase / dehydrase and lipid transport (243) ;mRNA; r:90757-91485
MSLRVAATLLLFFSTSRAFSHPSWIAPHRQATTRSAKLLSGKSLVDPELELHEPTERDRLEECFAECSSVETTKSLPPRALSVSSEAELPFSAEVAYDAFSNLTRQPEWSPWLHSVEFIDDASTRSKWTLKVLGVSYSWISIATRGDRPFLIEWESVSGLKNFGQVTFDPIENGKACRMVMVMTFVPPRLVSSVFRNSKLLTRFMEQQLIASSLSTFRDIIFREETLKPGSSFNSTMLLFPV